MKGLHCLESEEGPVGRGPSVKRLLADDAAILLEERKRFAGGVEGAEPGGHHGRTKAEGMCAGVGGCLKTRYQIGHLEDSCT